MKIAIFGKHFNDSFIAPIQHLFDELERQQIEVVTYAPFQSFLESRIKLPAHHRFGLREEMITCDVIISIGGDGTLLDSVTVVRDSEKPILGINTGRLGFLSNVSTTEIDEAIQALMQGNYTLDPRMLLEVTSPQKDFGEFNFALNEITIYKRSSASMIATHVTVDDRFLNTYWADGLIVSTPTGSTAYSLSCGGPIIMPGSQNIIFTPIAPHNLNVRPLVVPNDVKIRLSAEGREEDFLLTIDSRAFEINAQVEIHLKTAPFKINLINLEHQYFFNTIRKKMMWGADKRN